ncbi:MAG: hypothetical protein C4335_08500 [Armatimonadota bacterium]
MAEAEPGVGLIGLWQLQGLGLQAEAEVPFAGGALAADAGVLQIAQEGGQKAQSIVGGQVQGVYPRFGSEHAHCRSVRSFSLYFRQAEPPHALLPARAQSALLQPLSGENEIGEVIVCPPDQRQYELQWLTLLVEQALAAGHIQHVGARHTLVAAQSLRIRGRYGFEHVTVGALLAQETALTGRRVRDAHQPPKRTTERPPQGGTSEAAERYWRETMQIKTITCQYKTVYHCGS